MILKMLPKAIGSTILLLSYIALCQCKEYRPTIRTFPKGFLFGASTASYQIEGGWNADGKSENIWDHLTHKIPCEIDDCSSGDVAANSYYNYKRDVEMMRELGLDFYRFSISWTRILPTSFPDKISEAGARYYNNLINEMLKYNIEPMVTVFHWDLPQKLQDMGGWTNPHIVDWYADYARVAFELFGDRVKYWITINEPKSVCFHGYGSDGLAPRLNISGMAEYMCYKNLLLAHAKAYHIYDKEFRHKRNGTIFLSFDAKFFEPATDAEDDVIAAEEGNSFEWGIFTHPVYIGDYPPIVKEKVAAKSAAQGFPRSRLPELTPEEIQYIKGTSDIFGLNHYTTNLVYRNQSVEGYHPSPSMYDDLGAIIYSPSNWEHGAANWVQVIPWGFYKILTKIRKDYNNPPVFITENGYATRGGLNDVDRVSYYKRYISAMLDAIDAGCNVRGYSPWSLMDNFEWLRGYTERYGLYEVDFESPERTRTPRKSAFMYKEIVRTRKLDLNYEPNTTVMTIDKGH